MAIDVETTEKLPRDCAHSPLTRTVVGSIYSCGCSVIEFQEAAEAFAGLDLAG